MKAKAKRRAWRVLLATGLILSMSTGAWAATPDNMTISGGVVSVKTGETYANLTSTNFQSSGIKTIQLIGAENQTMYVSGVVNIPLNPDKEGLGNKVGGGSGTQTLYIGGLGTGTGTGTPVTPTANTVLTLDNLSVENNGIIEIVNNSTLTITSEAMYINAGGTVNMSGGELNIGDTTSDSSTGTLYIQGAGATLNAKDNDNFINASVKLSNGGLLNVVKDATLNISNDLTLNTGGTVTNLGKLTVDNLFVDGGTLTTKNLELGSTGASTDIAGDMTATNATISGGTVTVTSLDIQSDGHMLLSGGILEITGKTAGSLKTFEAGAETNTAGSLAITTHGALKVHKNAIIDGSNDLLSSVKEFYTDGGTIFIDGYDTGTLASNDAKTIITALVDGNAQVNFGVGAIIYDKDGDGNVAAENIVDGTINEGINVNVGAVTDGTVTISESYGADTIVVTGATSAVTVTTVQDGTTTLLGTSGGGNLIDAGNEKANITVAEGGTLQLGNVTSEKPTSGTISGNVNIANAGGATLNVDTGNFIVSGDIVGNETNSEISLGNSADLTAAKNVTTKTLTLAGGSGMVVGGELTATDIIVGQAGDTAGSELSIKTLASFKTLYIDPDWNSNSSVVAIESIGSTVGTRNIDGKIGVGQNSLLTIGTTNKTWLAGELVDFAAGDKLTEEKGSPSVGGKPVISAALGIFEPITIDANDGGILVDGTKTTDDFKKTAPVAGTFTLAANSLLLVNAATLGDKAAITMTGKAATIDKDSHIRITKPHDNQDITVIAGADKSTGIGSIDDKNYFDNIITMGGFYTVENIVNKDGKLSFTANADEIDEVFKDTNLDSNLYGILNEYNKGSKNNLFLNVNFGDNSGRTVEQQANAIEGATKIGAVSGVATSAGSVSGAGSSNTSVRTSLASVDMSNATAINYDGDTTMVSALSGAGGMKSGFGLWVMPMYQNHNAQGLESGSYEYGYDSNIYGVSIGADYTTPTNFRLGAAFHVGAGDSESSGDFANTTNDFNYYGFSLYTGYHFNNIGISADIGYSITDNEIEQDNYAGQLEADTDAQLFTAGLRVEYLLATEAMDFIPHVGVRVNSLSVDSFDTDFQGSTAFDTDSTDTTTVQFPIGVTLAKSFETNGGWNIRPTADIGVIFTTGDTDITQDVSIPGVAGKASMDSDIYDTTAFQGGLGISMSNGDFSLALDYNLNASEHTTSHGVFGTLRYEF